MYELRYKPPAQKYFKKLREKGLIAAYKNALIEISKDPHNAGEAKTGDLKGSIESLSQIGFIVK